MEIRLSKEQYYIKDGKFDQLEALKTAGLKAAVCFKQGDITPWDVRVESEETLVRRGIDTILSDHVTPSQQVPISLEMYGIPKIICMYLNNLGKQIGVERSKGNKIGEKRARDNYQKLGREHVQARAAEFRRVNSEPSELHVKMEIKRDGVGDKVGYNISEMKYFPKEGPNNPFMLTEWAKR